MNGDASPQRLLAQRAFTLIEVLIAIALVLALVGTMYGFLFDMMSSRTRVMEISLQESAASALFRQVDSDLTTCIVGDAFHGAGLKGSDQQLRILSRSVAAHLASRGTHQTDVFSDLHMSEYRFNSQQQRIEGRRGIMAYGSDAAPEFIPMEGKIGRLRFRYFDGELWHNAFDSLASDKLPVAVEISIWHRASVHSQATELPDSETSEPTAISQPPVLDDAEPTDLPTDAESPPDRTRIIIIPDAAAADDPIPEPEAENF